MKEIEDSEKSVLEIKSEDGKLYLASGSYCAVSNPENATRYFPLDDSIPERKEKRDRDLNWMKGCYDAEISFVPFLDACEEYKNNQ